MAAGAKGRKGRVGKNKVRIAAYYMSGRNLFNKARKLAKHLRRQPEDVAAAGVLKTLTAAMPRNYSSQL